MPKVVIEPDHSQPTGFHVVAITTKEQFNWISLFMHDPQQTRDMAQVCDLTLSNMGCMMIIRPPLFRFSSRGSLSSTQCQRGSIDNIPLLRASPAPTNSPLPTCLNWYWIINPGEWVQCWPFDPVFAFEHVALGSAISSFCPTSVFPYKWDPGHPKSSFTLDHHHGYTTMIIFLLLLGTPRRFSWRRYHWSCHP